MNREYNSNSCGFCESLGLCNSSGNNSSREKLLLKIQEIDFSIYETILYLDVYPDCKEALAYYHSLTSARHPLVAEYESKYGPLTAFSNQSNCSWDWTKSPWPWQC